MNATDCPAPRTLPDQGASTEAAPWRQVLTLSGRHAHQVANRLVRDLRRDINEGTTTPEAVAAVGALWPHASDLFALDPAQGRRWLLDPGAQGGVWRQVIDTRDGHDLSTEALVRVAWLLRCVHDQSGTTPPAAAALAASPLDEEHVALLLLCAPSPEEARAWADRPPGREQAACQVALRGPGLNNA